MDGKQVNPIQDLFIGIEKIIEFMEVKDQREFDKYETDQDMKDDAEMWIGARLGQDTYLTYRAFWNIAMFQEVESTVKFIHVERWMETPHNVPIRYRDNLLKRGREAFLKKYIERNEYVRRLNGLPPIDDTDFIYLSEPLRNQMHVAKEIPVHEMSMLIQNRYISMPEYQQVLSENPDKQYLRYLGIYKIDPFITRRSRDFELIRYMPMSRSDINPNLLKEFGSLYNEYRDYVMLELYNKNLEGIYKEYRTFMQFLIQCFVLMQITNKAIEGVNNRNFLDDSVLHIILSMHGVPRSLLMTKEVRRTLVINLLKLTREKATDEVYYNLVRILGYHDIIISKLMLMRGQEFDEKGQALFDDGSPIETFEDINKLISVNDETGEPVKKMMNDPYFLQIDLQDPNPYATIIDGDAPVHEYHKITDPDPMWWDLRDTQDLLKNSNYSIADSKYIMVEAVIHQIRYLFESIYFTRLILDNKEYTDNFDITIPEIFGTDPMSVYDIMVYILAATCMNNGLTGAIISEGQELLSTAGFNFDIDLPLFQAFLETTKHVDKDRVMQFIENLSMRTPSDINRLFNDVMYPMREWLEEKISQSVNRQEFLEYETIYRAFYTYDITKNSFLEDFKMPLELITNSHGLSDEEIIIFQHFYPRKYERDPETNLPLALKTDEFPGSKYYPFISHREPVTWNLTLEYKGTLYFHDILNSYDVRSLKNEDGEFIFLDSYDDGDGGITYEIDHDTVLEVIQMIERLSDDELRSAFFRVDTPLFGETHTIFEEGTRLPASLRRAGIFKQILIDKITMDCDGLAVPPVTYLEYLYRKNKRLYELLTKNNRFEYEREEWMENVVTIILALETELNMHMKYFEQSVVGSEMFFKPLITLIKHFKSKFVDFARTGLRYVLGDKIDSGGSSNMFKLFDHMKTTVYTILLSNNGIGAQFGFYDTEHKAKHKILIKDRSQMVKMNSDGTFDTTPRLSSTGSIRMVDEVKFFKNKLPIDPHLHVSSFYTGEDGTGRWVSDDDITMAAYRNPSNIKNSSVDKEGWKEFVESLKE